MKLRTKLFLGVGLLLFAMAIIMYIVPTIFIRKDVYKAAESIHDLLIKDHQQLVRSQQIWLEEVLEYIKQNNDSLLFMLYEDPQFRTKIAFNGHNNGEVWIALAHIINYDPSIRFVQAHAPGIKKAAVISPGSTALYPIEKLTRENGSLLLSFSPEEGEQEPRVFVGIPLPKEIQSDEGYTLYALVNPQNAVEELAEVHEEIAKLTPQLMKKKMSETAKLEQAASETTAALEWAIKNDMIRELTPLYVEGLAQSKAGEPIVPEGLARVDQSGHGYVILTQEIYSTETSFDDVSYYEQHSPKKGDPPIAAGAVLVTEPREDSAYIGNTMFLDETYLTIASPLALLGQQLALSSNKMIILQVKQTFWLGYDENGSKLSQKAIRQLLASQAFGQEKGTVAADNKEFYFSKIASLENGDLLFYDFHSLGGEESIVSTLLTLEDNLSSRISMQLSLIALGTMILVLLFIGRIGFTVIYPITKLASATQFVVAGRYAEVVLPDVADRKDEVAILTRSFADMVVGLQEREKIRGVLDKVVSKDVADEILRTQIHLGGEDRVVTMLFCDIRGFTELSAHFSPQKTIQILNVCMTKVSRVIEGEGGVIDKYVGDEVMAIYGAPTTHPDHALRAISSGMLIIETLKKWNQERAAAGEPLVEMGIGIHTGLVVAGNMGAEDRLNYTVVGAHVNLAARLCEVAKPNQLIVSAATLAEPNIEASFYAQALPPISLKGFSEPVPIYEIIGFKWEES